MTPSQLRNMIRQQQAKQKRAIDQYNREVKRAVDDYNRAVRAHNSKVRANSQRLERELARLARGGSWSGVSRIRISSTALHSSFVRVERHVGLAPPSEAHARFLELSEQETANSLAVLNALSDEAPGADEEQAAQLRGTVVNTQLADISSDLDKRWRGALYALNPSNPDAARHFCTSAREVFTGFLDIHAPDADVLRNVPSCETTQDGRPTRRSRIKRLLSRAGMTADAYEEFVSNDVENVLDLFHVFNDGTHGSAGRFAINELTAVKRRVEDGILFLASIVGSANPLR